MDQLYYSVLEGFSLVSFRSIEDELFPEPEFRRIKSFSFSGENLDSLTIECFDDPLVEEEIRKILKGNYKEFEVKRVRGLEFADSPDNDYIAYERPHGSGQWQIMVGRCEKHSRNLEYAEFCDEIPSCCEGEVFSVCVKQSTTNKQEAQEYLNALFVKDDHTNSQNYQIRSLILRDVDLKKFESQSQSQSQYESETEFESEFEFEKEE
eukprot:GHVP01016726.1.p1 GENE.GHVP01016726.1~~GHVP01016726.1.p1  ORF type:complete len:208 (+),score=45.37 GHVP01016726.1:41-664(+)